jgi:hypothetical protein
MAGTRGGIGEEAGIECGAMSPRGTISWPGLGKQGQVRRIRPDRGDRRLGVS